MRPVAALFLLGCAAGAQTPPQIHWSFAPAAIPVAGVAQLRLPDGWIYVQGAEMRRFLEASGNPLTGREAAVAGSRTLDWFTVVSVEDRLLPKDLRQAIRSGSGAANLIRARQGRETLDVLGYREPPRFDERRHALLWALDSRESGGRAVVNRFAYCLGSDAVIGFEQVTEESNQASAGRDFDQLLGGFTFLAGHGWKPEPWWQDWQLWACLGIALATALWILRKSQRSGRDQAGL